MAWDWASKALVEAEDLYDIKSSESSDDVVVAEVPVEPAALITVACEEEDDEVALDLLRMALYSSVDKCEVLYERSAVVVEAAPP